MKKLLVGIFITLIVTFSLFGYFHDEQPSLEIQQTTEELDIKRKADHR